MSRHHFSKKIAVVIGAASVVALTSCKLPPEQAWRKIQTEGLIAYWSYELGSQHANTHLKYRTPARPMGSVPSPLLTQPRITPSARPDMLDNTGRTLTAMNIPALPGFVRSPYTNPPRLVDVKGATPGTTMICPYTQRPFIIPDNFANPPGTMVAESRPAPKTENLPKVVINDKPVTQPKPAPAPSKPAPVQTTPAKPTPPPVVASTPPSAPVTPPPAPAPKTVTDIPYGEAIAGRPGFVNSPFAAKHQLVDVTGLPTGMEVKCPYTGKLFRVPPQDVASSKPSIPPLASPEAPPKKK